MDTVLLFRFSALTFNGHRIHYDLPYATGVEKYPGLVVHGPLQAMLLMDAAKRRHPGRRPAASPSGGCARCSTSRAPASQAAPTRPAVTTCSPSTATGP